MTYGPFQTKEGGDTISIFTKDELLPIAAKIEEIAIEVSQFHLGFFSSFSRKRLSQIENEYKKISVEFIKLYHKWNIPDILFKDLKIDSKEEQKLGGVMADYFQSQQAVMWHFNEGFRLLSYIDRILTEQSTAFYNRISITLSILAITISVVVAILK
ncbi:MAG: hypothetical protein XD75_0071 [Parcubacteria bacterium 33_209]|nr:MAG: hypothetical protein XD75_0071 [Parcubacteria bacterium 33_209]